MNDDIKIIQGIMNQLVKSKTKALLLQKTIIYEDRWKETKRSFNGVILLSLFFSSSLFLEYLNKIMLLKVDKTKVNKKVFLTIESVNNIIAGCLVYLIGSFMFESKKSSVMTFQSSYVPCVRILKKHNFIF